ncbi:phage scaffolding protein [Gemella sp. zg-570]|uniref:phage scaffolding protein n=1 Tax=Gemella sp. zg-570 TaxID=2840371 RepID=UPI001C0CFB77|nr:phage scaffolding protein [Gemella sp. zg-570]QWQ39310.1 phage scaffolding protein [Gemella sp. zg-570]
MKRGFLQALGLDVEVINKIMAEHGNTINSLQSINESNQDTIRDLQASLKVFEGVDVDDLKKQIADLQAESERKVNDLKIQYAIESALSGVKHKELLTKQVDMSKIKVDKDGQVKGLDEQVAGFKETYKEFFTSEDANKITGYKPANPEKLNISNSYDSLINRADSMSADEIADVFKNL